MRSHVLSETHGFSEILQGNWDLDNNNKMNCGVIQRIFSKLAQFCNIRPFTGSIVDRA